MNILREYFGKISEEQIKSNIRRIIASYRNVWDILVEVIQNSADAIIDKYGFEKIELGKIIIKIDTMKRKLLIEDNGCGISYENLSKILVTGASLKREGNKGRYGFMGFGLTFVAFQSKLIRIESTCDGLKHSATYKDLYKVVFEENEIPMSEEEKSCKKPIRDGLDSMTKIEIEFPDNISENSLNDNLNLLFKFCRNKELIEYIIRTRTAVGLLDTIFEDKKNFMFDFYVDEKKYDIDNTFFTNKELVQRLYPDDKRIYDIEGDYKSIIEISKSMPEYQQRAARSSLLLNTIVKDVTIGTRDPMKANLYIEGTSKENLNEYCKDIEIDGKNVDEYGGFKIQNGIWLAINGLPTGIQIDKLDHGTFLPYTCIVDIIDSNLKSELDAGRKGITDYKVKLIKDAVKNIMADKKFIEYRPYLLQVDTRVTNPFYDARNEYDSIFIKKNLRNIMKFNKYLPPNEEQEVISILIELVSNGILKGYSCKALSSYQVYDAYFNYSISKDQSGIGYSLENPIGISNNIFSKFGTSLNKDIIVEFKRDFECIYKDINKNIKDFSQIDLLICWDSNYSKRNEIRKKTGDQIVEVSPKDRYFYGTTHEVITKRQNPLPIIELKKIVELLDNKQISKF